MQEQKFELIDIESVWYQPWWKSGWFYAAVAFLSCLFLMVLLYYLYRRGWFEKKLSIDQQALKKLQNLATTSYDSQEKIYAAYFQMTLILKKYLATIYGLPLEDKTDIEIIPMLQTKIDSILEPLIAEFLKRAFQIKFARDLISVQMLQDDIKFVKKVIEETSKNLHKAGRS